MRKVNKTEREKQLEEQVKQLKSEKKRLKQQAEYNKSVKEKLKGDLKRVTKELGEEVKKTADLRKSLSGQRWKNLAKKIMERFPEETARSVLSELASSSMSGLDADSGE